MSHSSPPPQTSAMSTGETPLASLAYSPLQLPPPPGAAADGLAMRPFSSPVAGHSAPGSTPAGIRRRRRPCCCSRCPGPPHFFGGHGNENSYPNRRRRGRRRKRSTSYGFWHRWGLWRRYDCRSRPPSPRGCSKWVSRIRRKDLRSFFSILVAIGSKERKQGRVEGVDTTHSSTSL